MRRLILIAALASAQSVLASDLISMGNYHERETLEVSQNWQVYGPIAADPSIAHVYGVAFNQKIDRIKLPYENSYWPEGAKPGYYNDSDPNTRRVDSGTAQVLHFENFQPLCAAHAIHSTRWKLNDFMKPNENRYFSGWRDYQAGLNDIYVVPAHCIFEAKKMIAESAGIMVETIRRNTPHVPTPRSPMAEGKYLPVYKSSVAYGFWSAVKKGDALSSARNDIALVWSKVVNEEDLFEIPSDDSDLAENLRGGKYYAVKDDKCYKNGDSGHGTLACGKVCLRTKDYPQCAQDERVLAGILSRKIGNDSIFAKLNKKVLNHLFPGVFTHWFSIKDFKALAGSRYCFDEHCKMRAAAVYHSPNRPYSSLPDQHPYPALSLENVTKRWEW